MIERLSGKGCITKTMPAGDRESSTLTTFRDTDGYSSIRSLSWLEVVGRVAAALVAENIPGDIPARTEHCGRCQRPLPHNEAEQAACTDGDE